MGMVAEHKRCAARSTRGAGKSTTAAVVVLWFVCTRELAGVDWRVVTTASYWRQLTKYLWPEIRKWSKKLDFASLGMQPWTPLKELLNLSIKLEHGEAFAVACTDPESIEGLHADHILGIFDESKSIPDEVWDSAEGWFSSGDVRVLAVSTPGTRSGRFYQIFQKRAGFEDWVTKHVTVEEVLAAGRVSKDWVERRLRQFGESSPFYRQQVLGQFANIVEDGMIPLEWVESAVNRWLEYQDEPDSTKSEYRHQVDFKARRARTLMGVDVARQGNDKTVFAEVDGDLVSLQEFDEPDLMAVAGAVVERVRRTGASVTVDADGMGAGVIDRLRELGQEAEPFFGSSNPEWKDRTGLREFHNARAAAWWNLRDQLDPASKRELLLPDDDELIADLTAVRYKTTSAGKIQAEPKDKIKERLGRSPDKGDALVYAMWKPSREAEGAVNEFWYEPTADASWGRDPLGWS